jgi:hypothetical protein
MLVGGKSCLDQRAPHTLGHISYRHFWNTLGEVGGHVMHVVGEWLRERQTLSTPHSVSTSVIACVCTPTYICNCLSCHM